MNIKHQDLEDCFRSYMVLVRRHTLSSCPFDTQPMG